MIINKATDYFLFRAFDDSGSDGTDDRILIASGSYNLYVSPRLSTFRIGVIPNAAGTAGTLDVLESLDGFNYYSTGVSISLTTATPALVTVNGPIYSLRFVPTGVTGVTSYELTVLGR